MAQIAKTKDNDHFYIRPGQGTQQITDAGLRWLCKNGPKMPLAGESADLDHGSYQYLKNNGYLYIDNIDYEKRIAQYFASSSPEIEKDGPSLLLKLNSSAPKGDFTKTSWTLQIKMDEINTSGRDVLVKKEDVSIGCVLSDLHLSPMIELRFLHDSDRWPRVEPRSTHYSFYYTDWEGGVFPLLKAIPTAGLLDNWRGNVFCACEQSELVNYWRRFRTSGSISLNKARELYWLARMGKQPEWPGVEQTIGQPQDGWQLWHLQIPKEESELDNSLIEFERWLSYRDIRLNYLRWRIYLLNSLCYSIDAYNYMVQQGQPLLFGCIPPTSLGGNASLTIKSSPQQKPGSIPIFRQLLSTPLHNGAINYLRFQVPIDQQEYLLNMSGETARQSLHIQVAPRLSWVPDWLDGFQCCLKIGDRHYSLSAFTSEPSQSHECFVFQVSKHFALTELAQLTWDCSPAELPCSVRYEYYSPQGEDCYENMLFGTTASTLTALWQNLIWDKVQDSPWVKLTVDAGSFGRIVVKFQLKPEVIPQLETWWTNGETVTTLLWLSQSAQFTRKGMSYPLSPALQITLKQLCLPEVPAHITAAFAPPFFL